MPQPRSQSVVVAFVLTVPAADADLAADRLWQLGVRAIEERTPTPSASMGSSDRTADSMVELWTSLGSDPSPPTALNLEHSWSWRFEQVDATPAETWRRFARPVLVADRVVVVPAWQQVADAPDSPLPVYIEPGGAFGLGDHPTTSLSLAALIAALDADAERDRRPGPQALANQPSRSSVLDVGCGTGLLAIAAALLGAAPVRAVDVSTAAIEATADNARRNGVEHIVEVDGTRCGEIDGEFDLVVANILAPVLVSLADDLRRLTALDGHLVIGGVLGDAHAHVVEALRPMVVERVRHDAGWAAVTLRHSVVSG